MIRPFPVTGRVLHCCVVFPTVNTQIRWACRMVFPKSPSPLLLPGCGDLALLSCVCTTTGSGVLSRQRLFRREREQPRPEWPRLQRRCRSRHLFGVKCLTSLSTKTGRTQRLQSRNRYRSPPCVLRGTVGSRTPARSRRVKRESNPSAAEPPLWWGARESNPCLLPTACPMCIAWSSRESNPTQSPCKGDSPALEHAAPCCLVEIRRVELRPSRCRRDVPTSGHLIPMAPGLRFELRDTRLRTLLATNRLPGMVPPQGVEP